MLRVGPRAEHHLSAQRPALRCGTAVPRACYSREIEHVIYTGMAACLYELPRPLIVQRDEFENSKQVRIKKLWGGAARREDNIDDE